VYGVPYMTAIPEDASQGATENLSLTLRGFSPREIVARAERQCKQHFGECAWKIEETTCVPCMGSLGGHVLLYEARVVASSITAD
jgi:hypothetical protein